MLVMFNEIYKFIKKIIRNKRPFKSNTNTSASTLILLKIDLDRPLQKKFIMN